MEQVSTLETFDNLVASGVPEGQARAHVYALDRNLEHLATKTDLVNGLSAVERNLKIFFGYIVGGTFLVTILIPILLAIFLKYVGL